MLVQNQMITTATAVFSFIKTERMCHLLCITYGRCDDAFHSDPSSEIGIHTYRREMAAHPDEQHERAWLDCLRPCVNYKEHAYCNCLVSQTAVFANVLHRGNKRESQRFAISSERIA